jgi:hypothetical protein
MNILAWILAAIVASISWWFLNKPQPAVSLKFRSFDQSEPHLTEDQKAWALALTGVLSEKNGARHDILGGEESTPKNIRDQKLVLEEWWGIQSRKDLLESLQWIDQGGHRTQFERLGAAVARMMEEKYNEHLLKAQNNPQFSQQLRTVRKHYDRLGRKSILGWDYARFISLCRWGYLVIYLNENEAWNCIRPAARLLGKTFESWKDLGENYLIGREFWSYDETMRTGELYRVAYRNLLTHPDSPWNRLPWDVNLPE